VGAAIVTDPPTSVRVHRPDIPIELEAVVNKAMSKNPTARYATMKDLALALVPFAGAHAPTDVLRWSLAQEVDLSTIGITSSTTDPPSIEVSGNDLAQSVNVEAPPKSKKLAVAAVALIVVLFLIIIGLVSQRAQSSAAREPVTPSAAATAPPVPTATANSTSTATPSATAAAADSTNALGSRSASSARTHAPVPVAVPKAVRATPPASSAKPSEPSKKAWDNDSPLPPE
jgi:serine/threonine-protein kinase